MPKEKDAAATDLQRVYRGRQARRSSKCLDICGQVLYLRDIAVHDLYNNEAGAWASPNPSVRFSIETEDSNPSNPTTRTTTLNNVFSGSWASLSLKLDNVPPTPIIVIEIIDSVLKRDNKDIHSEKSTDQPDVVGLRRFRLDDMKGDLDRLPIWSTASGSIKADGTCRSGSSVGSVTFKYKLFRSRMQHAGITIKKGRKMYDQLESVEKRVARMHKRDLDDGFIVVLGGQCSELAHAFCDKLADKLQGGLISVRKPYQPSSFMTGQTDQTPKKHDPGRGELVKKIRRARASKKESWRYAILDDFCRSRIDRSVFEMNTEGNDATQVLRAVAFPDSYLRRQILSTGEDDVGAAFAGAPRHPKAKEASPSMALHRNLVDAAADFEESCRLVRLPDPAAAGIAAEDQTKIIHLWVDATVAALRAVSIAVDVDDVARTTKQGAIHVQRSERLCLHVLGPNTHPAAMSDGKRQMSSMPILQRQGASRRWSLPPDENELLSGRAMKFLSERDQEDEAARLQEAIARKRTQQFREKLPPFLPPMTLGEWNSTNAAFDHATLPQEPMYILEQRLAAVESLLDMGVPGVPGSAPRSPRKHGRTTMIALKMQGQHRPRKPRPASPKKPSPPKKGAVLNPFAGLRRKPLQKHSFVSAPRPRGRSASVRVAPYTPPLHRALPPHQARP